LSGVVITPFVHPECFSCWAQYSVLTEHRDAILAALKSLNIPTAIYYPKPLHLQDAFRYLGYKRGDFPASEIVASRIFSIPMHPYLDEGTQDYIVDAIKKAV
jgi:UDP-2-acetamido-2-deoxy-ribo-hexuluronate aminotransferase